ncbi:MAG: hypothetical protein WC333_03815 [Dehalococcoidia bacterium]|jgi:Na+/proline symporter
MRFKVALVLLIVGALLFLASIICLISLGDIEDDYDLLTFSLTGVSVGSLILLVGGLLRSRARLRSIIKGLVIIFLVLIVAVLIWLNLPYE